MSCKAIVVKAPGTNCELETKNALLRAGATAEILTSSELFRAPERLFDAQILVFPGGFAHGDDIASAKILANQCRLKLGEALMNFVHEREGFILGICNGFQVLVKLGLLPRQNGAQLEQEVSLSYNASGKYECRWVRVRIEDSPCRFLPKGEIWEMPVGHAEGLFVPGPSFDAENSELVALRYVDENDEPTQDWPQNPNGSFAAVAGICDRSGRVLGLMPHPDRSYLPSQHPQSQRRVIDSDDMSGARLFERLVVAAR